MTLLQRVERRIPRERSARGEAPVGAFDMKQIYSAVRAFIKDEHGTETLEWGLVCGLLVVGAIAAITAIGPKVTKMWENIDAKIK
jgi:Flp pilus assembly pilin Flp